MKVYRTRRIIDEKRTLKIKHLTFENKEEYLCFLNKKKMDRKIISKIEMEEIIEKTFNKKIKRPKNMNVVSVTVLNYKDNDDKNIYFHQYEHHNYFSVPFSRIKKETKEKTIKEAIETIQFDEEKMESCKKAAKEDLEFLLSISKMIEDYENSTPKTNY